MLLWFLGVSVLIVVNVFRSSGIDYRLVALGALAPLLIDLPFGHMAIGHALIVPVVLLAAVMLFTIGRPRMLRRRLLCAPIGIFCGLVLSGAFTVDKVFWWPALGWSFGHHPLLPAWWVVAIEEVIGLVAIWWLVGQFDLYLPEPRAEFVHTGHLREERTS
jgi:hypothetical protein